MTQFSEHTLETAKFFVGRRAPIPYGDGIDRAWLFELVQRIPDILDAVALHDGISIKNSGSSCNRFVWRVLSDNRPELLSTFLWKVRSQTTHKITEVVDIGTLLNARALDAVDSFLRQNAIEGKGQMPFKIREFISKAMNAPDPKQWCDVAVRLNKGDYGMPRKKLGMWLAKDHATVARWLGDEIADRNANAVLDMLETIGVRVDEKDSHLLVNAAKEYAGQEEKRQGLVTALIERGADWRAELDRKDTLSGTRDALAKHPLVKRNRLLDIAAQGEPPAAARPMKF